MPNNDFADWNQRPNDRDEARSLTRLPESARGVYVYRRPLTPLQRWINRHEFLIVMAVGVVVVAAFYWILS